ncbi:MAG: hypothetical protein ACJ714_01995, partial [Ornithinibacter sp.]
DDQSYRVDGTRDALRIVAASEAGATLAIYDLAAAVRAGHAVDEHVGRTVESELPFRMVDLGAVGVAPKESEWAAGDDYSHNSKAFADVILADAPYIDEAALEVARGEFEAYVRHALAEGYNAIAIPGFIEYLTFSGVGDGTDVYDADDTHVARAKAMQQAFGPMWEYAHDAGLSVYFRTDMLTLTTPLEEYLVDRFGSLATDDPEFWDVYAAGLDELYAAMPYLDGVLIRIGEAGRVYDLPGWDYYSELAVTSVDSVRAMLTALTAQAERVDREVIFRTWSVGVGAVGDMHTNPASYAAVLDGIDSPSLVVSTKYTLGDFYSHLPLNDTLLSGSQRRIVEFQSRREFESYGAFPNDLGAEYRDALQRLLAANPHIEGVWVWTQDGGPWRAGPMTLYLKTGFWQLYELNTWLMGSLARDPGADVSSLTADWARRWFSDDPATVHALAQAMAGSRGAVTQGLYIGPFAGQKVKAIGLEPPPMMWIFEWDILTGDSAVPDVISSVTGDRADEAVAEGHAAVTAAERMRTLVAGTDAATWREPAMRTAFLGTLDYEVDTLRLLAEYRELVLRQGQWHATGSPRAREQWTAALERYRALAASHLERYQGDLDHPAYNLTAAELGIARSERDPAMAWLSRGLLALTLGWLGAGAWLDRRRRGAPTSAVAATWTVATRPWRAAEVGPGMARGQRALLLAVPGALLVATRAVQTSFLAPVHLLVVLGAWCTLLAAGWLLLRGRVPWGVVAAVGGVLVARCALALLAMSWTGPGGYWYGFWTDPGKRTVYVTLAVAAFLWLLVAAGWALSVTRGRRRAAGTVLAAVGAGLAVPASVVGLVGLERALTAWNDQVGLLPWGLSRILGITVYLGIPGDAAWWVAGFGAVLLGVGLVLAIPRRRHRDQPGSGAQRAVAATG